MSGHRQTGLTGPFGVNRRTRQLAGLSVSVAHQFFSAAAKQPGGQIFAFPVGQIISTSSPHPVPLRGALRERHERGMGMRWTLTVLLTRAPDADGEDVWS
jgi:hypothetical protein